MVWPADVILTSYGYPLHASEVLGVTSVSFFLHLARTSFPPNVAFVAAFGDGERNWQSVDRRLRGRRFHLHREARPKQLVAWISLVDHPSSRHVQQSLRWKVLPAIGYRMTRLNSISGILFKSLSNHWWEQNGATCLRDVSETRRWRTEVENSGNSSLKNTVYASDGVGLKVIVLFSCGQSRR